MAAKLLHSLADDNSDLQKQIGCMTGIFQIFDRPNQRRLLPPPGNSKCSNGNLDCSTNAYNREPLERNSNNEKQQRASTESSRASFSSSSRSSSFSSLDCGRACEPEPSCLDRMIFPDTPSRDPGISQTSASPKMGRLSFDLRDVVKNSMYKDSRGLSVQTTVKNEYKDSPGQFQLSKSVDASLGSDIKESLRVLAKLRDAPWYYYEKELSNFSSESKEGSRFSYDGREMNRKIKDLPRLSLDSRESSSRIIDAKLTRFSENMPQPSRASSVVAKLMGLDTLPNAKPSNENRLGPIKTYIVEDRIPSCRSVRLPKSPKNSRKDPTSPKWRNGPMEPAPWKHMDASRVSPKQASKQVKTLASTLGTSPSVYGEMEKRLKEIEFKQSGKDLRALKQILEAMQEKGILEGGKKEEQNVNLVNNRGESRNSRGSPSKLRGNIPSKASESPIVIMKPANKIVQKSGIPSSSTDRRANTRNVRASQVSSSRPPQQAAKDTATSSPKTSGSISPRLQQKKLELDRRSRPPTPPPPPDSNKTRRQPSNHQSSENGSPGGRRRPKTSLVKQNEDQSSEKKNPRSLSCQETNTYAQSDANSPLEPIEETVVIDKCKSPGMESLKCSLPRQMDDVRLGLGEKETARDHSVTPEQPSPVSVLDSCSYMEGSPSPVKQTLHTTLQGDPISESDDTTVLEIPLEISREKLQSIDNLVEKLRRINSGHDETQTDYIASLCENSNPDHRYISEILLASGLLLRDLSSGYISFQLHPSGHPINPELFFVLEQTKTSLEKSKLEKFHRKLIFDSVNEILTGKLGPWAKPERLAKKTLNAQKLLRELCAEIELVQANNKQEEEEDGLKNILWEDVMHRSGNWTEFPGDVSGIVLDVERHIFKELVDDIVMGEAAERRIRMKPNRRSRQLFSK